jgi:2-polyprenyl-6-methoxyphenol hydroxylase-like FAD-dependent oxidoreductase
MAARVASDHFDRVTVLERDVSRPTDAPRPGAPQSSQLHVLLQAGRDAVEELFPGFKAAQEASCPHVDFGADLAWMHFGKWKTRAHTGFSSYAQTRPQLESWIYTQLEARDGVEIRHGVRVRGVDLDEQGQAQSVRMTIGDEVEYLSADLVVDCSGRGSKMLEWLEEAGFQAPPQSRVDVDIRYVTGIVKLDPSREMNWKSLLISPNPGVCNRAGVLQPLADGTWLFNAWGYYGDLPPTDFEGFLEFVKEFETDELYNALQGATVVRKLRAHKFPYMRWHHFEKAKRLPVGLIALGDGMCSVDPAYGQGMSIAALEALALGETLAKHRATSGKFARSYYRRCAKIIANPWSAAAGEAFRYSKARGDRPPGLGLLHPFVKFVAAEASHDLDTHVRFLKVMHLIAPPTTLFHPTTVARFVMHSLRSKLGGTFARLLRAPKTMGERSSARKQLAPIEQTVRA